MSIFEKQQNNYNMPITLTLQERISQILNNTKAYEQLGNLMKDIGLEKADLADLAYEIEEAIERIILQED